MPDYRREAEWRVLRARSLTRAGHGVAVAVGAADTTLAVTFPIAEPDAAYGVVATPSWNATAWVTGKTTAGMTLNFSAAPGGSGGTVDYLTFRSE